MLPAINVKTRNNKVKMRFIIFCVNKFSSHFAQNIPRKNLFPCRSKKSILKIKRCFHKYIHFDAKFPFFLSDLEKT